MPTLNAIIQRLQALSTPQDPVIQQAIRQLELQSYQAQLSSDFVQFLCQQAGKNPIEIALALLPVSACYAQAPISHFYVGAIAIGLSGNFYFGANQEFLGESIGQTIHAEQSAISHAWQAGEKGISDVVVNYTPCGHCRQFLNELNTAKTLKIHLPHQQNQSLLDYLPDAFGPQDLNIEKALFDEQSDCFPLIGEELTQQAVKSASQSYAPYSGALSGVALQIGESVICGRYIENAAFNPSLPPLQLALNYQRMLGLSDEKVFRVVMAEKAKTISHKAQTESFVKKWFGVELEYVMIEG